MELSLKIASSMSITILCSSIALGSFGIYRETTRNAMNESTSFYSEVSTSDNLLDGKVFPVIKVENQRVSLNETINPKEWVNVSDMQDGDITDNVQIFGTVNVKEKGEYELRYSVRNSLGLKSSKRIKIIVD